MIIPENLYSTIRKQPAYKPADGYSMLAFYDGLLKPHAVLLTIIGYLGLAAKNALESASKAAQGDIAAIVYLLILPLSILAWLRVIQSLQLARRDYPHLRSGVMDIIVFVFLLLFTTGVISAPFALKSQELLRIPEITLLGTLLAIYAACSLAGAANFLYLYLRIPDVEEYDCPVEQRIQFVNTAIFACLTAALGWAAYLLLLREDYSKQVLCALIGSTWLLLILNLFHSEQLSLLSKFLLHNKPDEPKNQLASFKKAFPRAAKGMKDEDILKAVFPGDAAAFKSVKTVRASSSDAETIAGELVCEFGYIFAYLFNTQDQRRLQRAVALLVRISSGFGALGYMRYYFIVSEGRKVGLIKIDTHQSCGIRRLPEPLLLPIRLALALRTFRLIGILQRTSQLTAHQRLTRSKELRLSHLIIFQEFRKQGYGQATVTMLVSALLRSVTNEIEADRITLFVREKNTAAIRLFENTGFTRRPVDHTAIDPLATVDVGAAMLMECTKDGSA